MHQLHQVGGAGQCFQCVQQLAAVAAILQGVEIAFQLLAVDDQIGLPQPGP